MGTTAYICTNLLNNLSSFNVYYIVNFFLYS